MLSLLCATYLLYLVPTAVGGFLVWLIARKRIRLHLADWLLLLLPFLVWSLLIVLALLPKSLSNAIEAFYLGCAVTLLFALRALLGSRAPQQQGRLAVVTTISASAIAIVLWSLMPFFPE
jgi:hypothetical protein